MRKTVIIAAIILFGGCGHIPQNEPGSEAYTIPFVINNFVNEQGTFWEGTNGVRGRRVGECSAQTICNFTFSARAAEYFRSAGVVQVAFQHMFDGRYSGQRPVTYIETPYFEHMIVELTINRLDYYLVPTINPDVGGDWPKQVQ